jgi:hypothetical protein
MNSFHVPDVFDFEMPFFKWFIISGSSIDD